MIWIPLSLLMAVFIAGMRLTNQHYRVDGFQLLIYSRIIMILPTLPVLFFVDWPVHYLFYLSILATVPIVLALDKKVFNLCAQYGGGPVSRLEPLNHVITFLVWFAVQLLWFGALEEGLFKLSCIFFCIGACVFFAFEMRKGKISAEIFREMAPVILALSVTAMLNKLAMDYTTDPYQVALYVFLQSLAIVVCGLPYLIFRQKLSVDTLKTPPLFRAVLVVSCFAFLGLVFKSSAFRFVDNPAYVTVFDLTAPLWILLYNRISGYPDNIKILPGLGIVASVAGLIMIKALL